MKWSFILCLLAVYSVQALPNLDKEVDINKEEKVAESNKKFEKTVEVNGRDKREVGDDPMPEGRVKRESGPEPKADVDVDVDVNVNVPGDNVPVIDVDVAVNINAGGIPIGPVTSRPPMPESTVSMPATTMLITPVTPLPSKPATFETTTTMRTTSEATTSEAKTTKKETSTTTNNSVKKLFCDADCGRSAITWPRIVGGEDASVFEYPWQVLLYIDSTDFAFEGRCGGSIIKKGWILSAAHCFVDGSTLNFYRDMFVTITFAEHDADDDTETNHFDLNPEGEILFVHPQYKKGPNAALSEDNDLALLYIGGDLIFRIGIKPICMPTAEDYKPESDVIVTGWGTTSVGGDAANILQEVTLQLKSADDCNTLNDNAPETYDVTDNMVCAIADNKDSCQGDSGGPMITQSADGRWIQLGIVSFGYQCAFPNVPGFYTKVSNYLDWITETTNYTEC